MKYILIALCFLMVSVSAATVGGNQEPKPAKEDKEIYQKVNELLGKMTIEEKVGQMTQVTMQVISKQMGNKDQAHILDEQKLEEAIVKYHVGSLLNVYDAAFTLEHWQKIISLMEKTTKEKTRLGIPVLYGIDAIHGATYTTGATLFPQAISVGASFNKEIAEKAGMVTSREIKASGIPWNFYPVLDVARQPLWPRTWESFGEDPFLVSTMGVNYINGAQGADAAQKDKALICLKHYVGYGFPFNGKDRTPSYMSERTLREVFLPPFEHAVKAGALTVMVNSGEIDGIPVHSDKHILTDILKGELKFKGFIVSDWEDIKRLYTRDRVAATPREAVKMAVLAGLDMSMVPTDYSFYELLLDLIKSGEVPMSRIDDAVSRILYVKMKTGIFDGSGFVKEMVPHFASAEHTTINKEAAKETIILAKNDGVLPLKKGSKILVTGPTANMLSVLNGGWTITWQGSEESLYPQEKNTVLEAMQNQFGKENITYVEGTTFDSVLNIGNAVTAAAQSDVVVLCLGEKTYCETPGNINDLDLDKAQVELAEKLIATGKPVVLVMLQGRPRTITSIVEKSKAVLLPFLPGMEGADAIAEILAGVVNPSAKMPITYPRASNDIIHYDHKPIEVFDVNAYNPLFKFGHGLSYTTFEYSNLSLSKNSISTSESLTASVTVKNTGKMAGKEPVLLFVTDMVGSVSRPVLQLKGFEKIMLNPGESKTVTFTITPEQLSFIGRDNTRIIEPGDFTVTVESLKAKFLVK